MHNLLKQQQDAEIMTGQSKEVEEWLMGSGESAETAASHGLKGQVMFKLVDKPKLKQDNIENDQPQEEEWMFRTFSKNKQAKENIPITIPVTVADKQESIKVEKNVETIQKGGDPFQGLDDFIISKRTQTKHNSGDNAYNQPAPDSFNNFEMSNQSMGFCTNSQ